MAKTVESIKQGRRTGKFVHILDANSSLIKEGLRIGEISPISQKITKDILINKIKEITDVQKLDEKGFFRTGKRKQAVQKWIARFRT